MEMDKGHLAACGVGLLLALAVVNVTGGSVGGLGLLVAALVCPIAIVAAVWLLMGGRRGCAEARSTRAREPRPAEERA
jgi:hypothetical protein